MAPDPPHIPVLGRELRSLVAAGPGETVVDGTFGAGGHARILLADLKGVEPGSGGSYIAIDRDPSATARADVFAEEASEAGVTFRFEYGPFADVLGALASEGVSADAVILDVGVSSMQLDEPGRGFAYAYDAPLDMRMDPSQGHSAAQLLAEASEDELTRILFEYGEEHHARRIVRAIVERRAAAPILRTAELVDLILAALPAKVRHAPGGHPARRTFQALRIAVNDELGQLDRGLDAALELLRDGGRLVVIAFHSLEDRIVKQRFAAWQGKCTCPPGLPVCSCGAHAKVSALTRKAVRPQDDELAANPRAASARLRAVARLVTEGAA